MGTEQTKFQYHPVHEFADEQRTDALKSCPHFVRICSSVACVYMSKFAADNFIHLQQNGVFCRETADFAALFSPTLYP